MAEFWIWCGLTPQGAEPDAPMLIQKARQLAAETDSVTAVVVSETAPDGMEALCGADRILWGIGTGRSRVKAEILSQMIQKFGPDYILFPATMEASQIAAFAAARFEAGLSADCTDLRIENGQFLMHRPAFGGGVEADIVCPSARFQLATVRPGIFGKPARTVGAPTRLSFLPSEIPADPMKVLSQTVSSAEKNLWDAEIVVAGGLGVGSKENFRLLQELADALGGQLAGSRAAVDAGYVSWKQQIGQTGTVVHPRLYLAFGVSGAIQHIAGMRGAAYVIAVNSDSKAPIFDYSDVAIVSDWKTAATSFLAAFA